MGEGLPRPAMIRLKSTEDLACSAMCGSSTHVSFRSIGGISSERWPSPVPRRCAERSRSASLSAPSRSSSGTGSTGAASNGDGPTFYVRSPRAAAHALRAPGQLGLGRAYVSGELEVDDIDAVIELLDGWQPASAGAAPTRLGYCSAAVRAAGLDAAAAPTRRRASAERAPPQQGARRRGRPPSLRRLKRVLLALPRRLDDLQLRDLLARRARRSRKPRRRSSRWSARKLALQQGERILDVGCGWGSFPIQAATRARRRAWSASPSPRRRPSAPASGPRPLGSPIGSRSA